TSCLLLFLFAYPLISELPFTSPLYIWQGQISLNPAAKPRDDSAKKRLYNVFVMRHIYWLILLIAVIAYLYWFMNFSLLTLFFIDVTLLSIGFLYVLSVLILSMIRLMMQQTEGVIRRGLSQLVQYPESVSIQIVGFTLVLMAILILKLVRT